MVAEIKAAVISAVVVSVGCEDRKELSGVLEILHLYLGRGPQVHACVKSHRLVHLQFAHCMYVILQFKKIFLILG